MAVAQLQLKEKQEEVAAAHLQLKEKQDEIESQRRRAAEAENAHTAELARLMGENSQAENAHAAELARLMGENSQFMEEKKSVDKLKKTFENEKCLSQLRHSFSRHFIVFSGQTPQPEMWGVGVVCACVLSTSGSTFRKLK